MIRLELQVELNYQVDQYGADFVFNIHAAQTRSQVIASEKLELSQPIIPQMYTDPLTGNRYMRVRAQPGPLKLTYAATVDLTHHCADASQLAEVPISRLPLEVISYIYPSRYGRPIAYTSWRTTSRQPVQGYSRVQAFRDWVIGASASDPTLRMRTHRRSIR